MKKKDHIDEHKEWQDNQFNPGYFTGGKIPIWLKDPGNKRNLGIYFITLGILLVIHIFIIIFKGKQIEEFYEVAISTAFAIILLLAGIKFVKKKEI